MANQATAFFYWYRRYKVRAADMTAFQQAMVESVRGLGEGAFGASVLRGFDVSIGSGLLLDIGPGIAQAASGFLQVLSSSGAVDATSATGGLPTRSLVVARATPVDANFICFPASTRASTGRRRSMKSRLVICSVGSPMPLPHPMQARRAPWFWAQENSAGAQYSCPRTIPDFPNGRVFRVPDLIRYGIAA